MKPQKLGDRSQSVPMFHHGLVDPLITQLPILVVKGHFLLSIRTTADAVHGAITLDPQWSCHALRMRNHDA